jgi:periplasmic divalent cation tolerance protein
MNDEEKVVVVFTACPSAEIAGTLARSLVEERLAACVNQIPGVTSTYIWKDTLQTDAETVLMIKTTAGRFDALKARVKELHPYELPELIAIPVCGGAEKYLAWVSEAVAQPRVTSHE